MRVNIFDVAKKSGLSVVTVSRVINNSPSVREYNKRKVLQAMEELGYRPNAAARSLAMGRTGIVGLLLPNLHDTFFNDVVKSIDRNLMRYGYFLAISIMNEVDGIDDEGSNYLFQEKRVDGIILLTPVNEDEYILEMKKKDIPFVLIDNQLTHPSVNSILVDNYKGGLEAAKHLLELGHKKIAHIAGPKVFLSSRERERGFRDALAGAGIEPYIVEEGNFEVASGFEITKRWIEQGKHPTAVFAADDYIALGAVDAIRDAGLNVPGDISVVGYDDNIMSSALHPHLTTVKQPAEDIGFQAAEIMMQLIQRKLRKSLTVKLEPRLIIRQSTGTPLEKSV